MREGESLRAGMRVHRGELGCGGKDMSCFSRLHARLGDFWWYSILLFVALRCGDLINAFIGLWLVPKYVPQAELGAVLPLLQITGFFGLPITILVVVFTKYLNHFQTLGEKSKVKSLIHMFWTWASVSILLGTWLSLWLMPHFFERIRVASGSLGILIVATSVLGTTAPVFTNALQALKKFKSMTVMNLFCAPIRLVVMLVAMPFRALSGYMLGQCAPSAFQIVWSWFALRQERTADVEPVPFWRDGEGRKILRYAVYVAIAYAGTSVLTVVFPLVIRQRLPEFDSAAYYIISRFAELATYVGQTLMIMIFPFAAEARTQQRNDLGVFVRSGVAVLAFGVLCAIVLRLCGGLILGSITLWKPYVSCVPHMAWLALALTIGVTVNVFVSYEIAAGRFLFLLHLLPLSIGYAAFLVCFTGYGFFQGCLPASCVDWMASLKIATLDNFILSYLIFNVLTLIAVAVQCMCRYRREMSVE